MNNVLLWLVLRNKLSLRFLNFVGTFIYVVKKYMYSGVRITQHILLFVIWLMCMITHIQESQDWYHVYT